MKSMVKDQRELNELGMINIHILSKCEKYLISFQWCGVNGSYKVMPTISQSAGNNISYDFIVNTKKWDYWVFGNWYTNMKTAINGIKRKITRLNSSIEFEVQ